MGELKFKQMFSKIVFSIVSNSLKYSKERRGDFSWLTTSSHKGCFLSNTCFSKHLNPDKKINCPLWPQSQQPTPSRGMPWTREKAPLASGYSHPCLSQLPGRARQGFAARSLPSDPPASVPLAAPLQQEPAAPTPHGLASAGTPRRRR